MAAVITEEEYKQLNWYRSTWIEEKRRAIEAEKENAQLRTDIKTLPQKISDLIRQSPMTDESDDPDCISRDFIINQIEKLVNRKLDDDSLWLSGEEWKEWNDAIEAMYPQATRWSDSIAAIWRVALEQMTA